LKEAIDHFGKGDSALNGIIVCTPTFAHDPVIREAAEHGLHIFTEKPVDETAEKVSSLFDHCEKHNVKLCCGFQRRFDLTYKAVADAVRGGKIGKALSASIFFADHPCPPIEFLLTGGDIFMDLSAHDVDYIAWALNDAPINVATISSGFEKGDFLVREEKGQRVYFDFFEEAFNYLANKGYTRMKDGKDWMEAVNTAHSSIPNGTRYNTGVLLMVLSRPVDTRNFYNRISQGSVGVEKNIDHDGGLV